MKKTKIDWCDCTINPVIGCLHGCPYCYARRLNDRFHFIEKWTEPVFFEDRLKQLCSKTPKAIFMNSMSDIAFWEDAWVDQCLHAMENNPQHNYIFLTKAKGLKYSFFYNDTFNYSCNLYFGRSITRNNELSKTDYCNFSFWSIEPLLEPIKIDFNSNFNHIRQVIIGAETGNRIDKVVPKKEWVDDIVKQCDKANVRVFMKSSLKKIMGKDFRQDKLLWEK